MKPWTTSPFSLLFVLLLPQSSLFYSLKNCTISYYEQDRIICDDKKLTTIPKDIPNSATSLSLSVNQIQKIQRTDLTDFTRLVDLNLKKNHISHIEDGAFSDLCSVTDLTLSSNKLTNLKDETFKGLSNLTSLFLSDNQIHSVSRFAFEPLKKLQLLRMDFNKLFQMSDIVNIVSHAQAFKNIRLDSNNLTTFDSELFPQPLLNLMDLDLSTNPLKKFSVHQKVFPNLKRLALALSGFDFDWEVSDGALTSVRSLTVDMNPLLNLQTYKSIFQSVDSVENVTYLGVHFWSVTGLLAMACEIPTMKKLGSFSNSIPTLNETIFKTCTNLTELHLQGNHMKNLTETSLKMLTGLKRLTIANNELSKIPLTIRNMSTLTYLSFEENMITELHCLDFTNLGSLTKLKLNSNRISKINDACVFKDLKNLKVLELEDNHLTTLSDSFGYTLPHLVTLKAEGNNFAWLNDGTFENLPALVELNVKSIIDNDAYFYAFTGLTELKQLTFSSLTPDVLTYLSLSSRNLNQLAVFLPQEDKQTQTNSELAVFLPQEDKHALTNNELFVNLPSLQELTVIGDNPSCFYKINDLLKDWSNIKKLAIESFECCINDKDTFISVPELIYLKITKCDEFSFGPEVFLPLAELRILDLTNNNIDSLNFFVDAHLTKVEQLILRNNALKVINETVFAALPSLKYLDLSGNPFACNCSNVGFIEWAIRNKQVQVVSAFQYRCSTPWSEEGNFLMDFNVQSCWEFTAFLCFISTSALVLLNLLPSFIFHFLRWQLVYGYYLLLAFLYDSKKRRRGCRHIYDAFVSYNHHDEDWVYRKLLPELEGRQGWKLCLHHRDFIPGTSIIDNITDAIYSSRKTVCVISRWYLESEWCSKEIQLASFRLFDERKDVLVLLFLEEISSYELSPFYRMRKLVKSRTYLSWTQARGHDGLFWEKVRQALESGDEPGDNHNPLTTRV